jgi:hypothetical protein
MAYQRKMAGMTLNDTIKLVDIAATEDADGYETFEEKLTEVKCDSGNGVTRTEFYEAYKAGLELSAAFSMWACDYGGQKEIEHNGKRYKVERAFPTGDGAIQLNCSEVKR